MIALVGVGFALLAVLIYRKRHLETAGDFLALNAAKPVFLVVFTLAISYLFDGFLPGFGMLAGLFVGIFAGKMLLERTVRVFKGKTFLFWGVINTLFILSMALVILDPFGVTRYVPDTEDVQAACLYDSADRYDYEALNERPGTVTDPAEIDEFRQFHAAMSDGRHQYSGGTRIFLEYELKNGRSILREYLVPVDSLEGEFVQKQFSSWQAVFQCNDWDNLVTSITEVHLDLSMGDQMGETTLTDRDQILGLLEAIRKDCEAGNMAQTWNLHGEDEETTAWVYIFDSAYYEESEDLFTSEYASTNMHRVYALSLTIYSSCEHTNAYLDSLGLEIDPYEK